MTTIRLPNGRLVSLAERIHLPIWNMVHVDVDGRVLGAHLRTPPLGTVDFEELAEIVHRSPWAVRVQLQAILSRYRKRRRTKTMWSQLVRRYYA